MFRKQTFVVGVIAALLIGMMTIAACGAAAKQMKPDGTDADGGDSSAESQPSN